MLSIVIRSSAQKGASFGQRFLAGLVLSLMIGLSYGLIAGLAGVIFDEQIAQRTQDATSALSTLLSGSEEMVETTNLVEPMPGLNFVSLFFSSLLFNAIIGSLFSAIFAAIFRGKSSDQGIKSDIS